MKDLTKIACLLSKLVYYQKTNARSISIFGGHIEKKFLNFLISEGLVPGYSSNGKLIDVTLGYNKDGLPLITVLKKISPGHKRMFISVEQLKKINPQLGVYVLSTHQGFLTNFSAVNRNIGGFLLYYLR
jgi:small subunit ribosomal protein S8